MRAVVAVITLVACVHAGIWALAGNRIWAPDFEGRQFASISYAPSERGDGQNATAKLSTIRADMRLLAPYTRAIRTYSSTNGYELIAGAAAEQGLKVNVGIWLDKDVERNNRELKNALDLARRHKNVISIIVGNETILRGEFEPKVGETLTTEEAAVWKKAQEDARRPPSYSPLKWAQEKVAVHRLVKIINEVKKKSPVPVTTGEIYNYFLEHDELAAAVDYIAAHVLPYWSGVPENAAVDYAVAKYQALRDKRQGKRIVIAEFGWPSAGYNYKSANAGRIEQATVLRNFVARAEALGIDYNLVEAIDQPWKFAIEGGAGGYWGIFDAWRQPKFSWTGPIENPDHWKLAGLAILLGFLFSLPILALSAPTLWQTVTLAAAANLVGVWPAIVFSFWDKHYFVIGAAFALGLGLLLLIPLIAIAFARIDDIAAIAFGRKPRRLALAAAPSLVPAEQGFMPKVSIHVPAYFEPPEMLKATLDSVARLEYANFECVVVVNNTPDPAFWMPVQEHCLALGERFKFVNAESLPGFKAGALRLALAHTAPDAEVIGVIDADYMVQPEWLKDLAPLFADPKVGMVQAPQDHRDGDRSVMHHAMNGEYAGFFDIGMVQRNEFNAIIAHGTMCLIRRAALDQVGGWSSDTICEDTDLGLSILEHGWLAHYTNRRYGHGLLPDTFEAYKKQRHRWAYGGFQILKKHWRRFLPGASRLTREQKREFALGWLNWLGAETIGVAVAILNLIWVPFVAFAEIAVPDSILTIPILAAFLVSVLHFVALYRLRVAIPKRQLLGAVVAAMSTQWTVARAISHGLVRDHIPFVRTAKGGRARRGPDFPAFWEAVLAGLLLIAAIVLVVTNHKEVREIYIFAAVLVVQSLPFISAVVIAALEATPFNDYVFLRNLRTRTAALLPRRVAAAGTAPVAAPAVAPPPAPAPVAVEAAVRPEPAPAAAEVVPS
jgi:cellulose synthase/poly-beta-1,6-N-acetylglucosamine synthase-like glycosyltransferase/exo-beta-1,3-glucanase (GH17 family)